MLEILGNIYNGFNVEEIELGDYWVIDYNIWRIIKIDEDNNEITVIPDYSIDIYGTYDQVVERLDEAREYLNDKVFTNGDVIDVDLPEFHDIFESDRLLDTLDTSIQQKIKKVGNRYWFKHVGKGYFFIDEFGQHRTRMQTNQMSKLRPKIVLKSNNHKKKEEIANDLVEKLIVVFDQLKDICKELDKMRR